VNVVDKYLARYAEPEHALAGDVADHFARVIVVPASDEDVSLLDGYRAAARAAEGPTLVVVVVNGSDAAAAAVHAENARLLQALSTPDDDFSVFAIDRASPGQRLSARGGVGLARRIGCDFALALWRRGKVSSPFVVCTDADATLPADAFASPEPAAASAVVSPFRHVPGGDALVDLAHTHYELSLRHYVLGLAQAGSPYAFHTVGSTLRVHAERYAEVRGFPPRSGGEDFHLLAKLAKVAPVHRGRGSPILIRARASERVPFGTGPAVKRLSALLAAEEEPTLHDPRVFARLGEVLAALNRFAVKRTDVAVEPTSLAFLRERGLDAVLQRARRENPSEEVLRRRLHEWFDALATLRLIHRLRDAGLPPVPWRKALGFEGSPEAALQLLSEREQGLSPAETV
jgi:hypothetical protein